MQRAGRHSDNPNPQARVQKRIVQIASLKRRHAAILPRLTIEDEVDGDHGTADEGAAIEQLLPQGPGVVWVCHGFGGLQVRALRDDVGNILPRFGDG